MIHLSSLFRKRTITIFLAVLLVLMLGASGCTQPSSPQAKTPAPVTVTQTDSTHMLVAYPGSTDMSNLLELEVTVTDSAGKIQTRSLGSRLATSPLRFGATLPLSGTFDGNDHVLVTGYFMDGSKQLVLDTTI